MRVFRTIILLTGIAVLMPSPPESENSGALVLAGNAAETAGLVTAASQAVSGEGRYECHAHGAIRPGLRPVE